MMRRSWSTLAVLGVLAFLASACSVGAASATRPVAPHVGYGIAADFIDMKPDQINQILADYRSTGMTWARVQVLWFRAQATKGGPYNWTEYDSLFAAMNAHGIRPIGLLSSTPSWARAKNCTSTGGWEYACPPADITRFADFGAAAAAHFADYDVVWEVWNEPNLKAFWQPAPDAAQYTRLLTTTYDAIKAVDPDSTVISAGLAVALNPYESIDPVTFLGQIYDKGGSRHFDGVGWHPYVGHEIGKPPPPLESPGEQSSWLAMYGTPTSARSLMETHGDAAKKIWITEFGNHTSTDSMLAATEDQQASIMSEAVRLWSGFEWAGALCFYTYKDSQAYGASSNGEAYFGLWRVDGSPKPAVAAVRSAIADPGTP
jgi:polysaccharide biosynthesis protein PslG